MAGPAFDVVIGGGGSAGYAAARAAGAAGARVGLIERGPVGGLCILNGCIPSKAVIRSSSVLHLIRTSTALGIQAPGPRADFGAVVGRSRALVNELAASRRRQIERAPGVTLVLGEARFVGRRELVIRPTGDDGATAADGEEASVTARRVVLTTGSTPVIPEIPGLDEAGYLTSDDALWLEKAPASLVVIGAGLIALELGQFFARMGTRVTLVERSDRVLSAEDEEVGETLGELLREEGIRVLTNATAARCRRRADGMRVVTVKVGDNEREVAAEGVLVALGRRAALDGLEVERAGVRVEEKGGFVPVNLAMRSSAREVFAAGDVIGPRQLTHLAVLEGEVAGANAARDVAGGKGGRGGSRRMDYSVVPSVVFTDPPFARVGLSEREAREQGVRYVVSRVDYINVAVAEVLGQTRGFVKLLAEPGGGRLVGAQVLGHQAETLIHELSTAMSWGIRAGQLAHAPHFHPSPSEILVEAAEKLGGR